MDKEILLSDAMAQALYAGFKGFRFGSCMMTQIVVP